jgi:hypothetical protein
MSKVRKHESMNDEARKNDEGAFNFVIRHSSFVILLCTGYCVLGTPCARAQPNGLFPETIIAGPGLSSTASGRTLTLSVTAAGGTTFTPGLNLSLAAGTLNAGSATLGSAAYTNSGSYEPAFTPGNGLLLAAGNLSALLSTTGGLSFTGGSIGITGGTAGLLAGYVPYSGATSSVSLGSYSILASGISPTNNGITPVTSWLSTGGSASQFQPQYKIVNAISFAGSGQTMLSFDALHNWIGINQTAPVSTLDLGSNPTITGSGSTAGYCSIGVTSSGGIVLKSSDTSTSSPALRLVNLANSSVWTVDYLGNTVFSGNISGSGALNIVGAATFAGGTGIDSSGDLTVGGQLIAGNDGVQASSGNILNLYSGDGNSGSSITIADQTPDGGNITLATGALGSIVIQGNLDFPDLTASSLLATGTSNIASSVILGRNATLTGITTTSGGTLNVGTATFGSAAYTASNAYVAGLGSLSQENSNAFSISGTGTLTPSSSTTYALLQFMGSGSNWTTLGSNPAGNMVITPSANAANNVLSITNAGGTNTLGLSTQSGGGGQIVMSNTNGSTITFNIDTADANGNISMSSGQLYIHPVVDFYNNIAPFNDNAVTCGAAGQRWSGFDATTGTIGKASTTTPGWVIKLASSADTADAFQVLASNNLSAGATKVFGISGGSAAGGVAGAINSAIGQTTLTPTGAGAGGTIVCSMPFQGASYKQAILFFSGYSFGATGGDTYTFPTAFTQTPFVSASNVTVTATLTTTSYAVTVASGQTGWVTIEGY